MKLIREYPLTNALRERLKEYETEMKKIYEKKKDAEKILKTGSKEDHEEIFEYVEKIQKYDYDMEDVQRKIEDLTFSIANERNDQKAKSFLLSSTSIKKGMMERDKFMELREENFQKLIQLKEKYTEGTEDYEYEMNKFYDEALKEFWDTFLHAENVTMAVVEARKWFLNLDRNHKWIEMNQSKKNLTVFGNMVTRMMSEFDKTFNVKVNFKLTMIGLIIMLCAYRFHWGLRPNLLLIGEGGTGKSFILDLLEEISIEGSVMALTHITTQAFNTNQDMSDLCILLHEVPIAMMAMDKYGNETSSDEFLKNRMTSQKTTTFHYVNNNTGKKRESEISYARCMGNTIGLYNEKRPSKDSPIMQRFLIFTMRSGYTRKDMDDEDIDFKQEYVADDKNNQLISHGYRLKHFYLFLIEKAIEAGALPDVNLGCTRDISKWIFAELKRNGVPKPSKRKLEMYFHMCRVFTIYYAIEAQFFSEFGLKYREDTETKKFKDFNILYLKDIIKFLCASEEISVFVLTLLEDVWIPTLKSEIVESIFYHMVSSTKSNKNEWNPNFDETGRGTRFREDYTNKDFKSNAPTTDYRYVEIYGKTFASIAQEIKSHIKTKPSEKEIECSLYEMQQEVIKSYDKEIQGVPTGKKDKNNKEIQRKELTDIKDKEKKKIPSVIMEVNPRVRNQKKVSIAIDLIHVNYSNVLKICIKNALEHREQGNRTYITGFHLQTEEKIPIGKSIHKFKNSSKEIYCNAFDIITLEEGKEHKIIMNNFCYSDYDIVSLYNRRNNDMDDNNRKETLFDFQKQEYWILDKSIDEIHFVSHWIENGLDIKNAQIAFPPLITAAIWTERETNLIYSGLNRQVLYNYPEDFMKSIHLKKRKQEEVERKIIKYKDENKGTTRGLNLNEFNRYSNIHSRKIGPNSAKSNRKEIQFKIPLKKNFKKKNDDFRVVHLHQENDDSNMDILDDQKSKIESDQNSENMKTREQNGILHRLFQNSSNPSKQQFNFTYSPEDSLF